MNRLFAFALVAFVATAGPAAASPITVGDPNWYEFLFGGPGSFATNGTGAVPSSGGNSQFAPNPPWTFTSSTPATVTITDAFATGDSFSLFDFGTLIGSTPVVPGGFNTTSDPAIAVLNPAYSSGTFLLGPGSHSLTIRADNSPSGSGAAYFRVDAAPTVPEPATLCVLGALTGVGGMVARRRAARV